LPVPITLTANIPPPLKKDNQDRKNLIKIKAQRMDRIPLIINGME